MFCTCQTILRQGFEFRSNFGQFQTQNQRSRFLTTFVVMGSGASKEVTDAIAGKSPEDAVGFVMGTLLHTKKSLMLISWLPKM